MYASVIVKGGHGRLSNTIVELQNTSSSSSIQATTSAYWAFVDVILPHTTNTVIEITINIVSVSGSVPSCESHDQTYYVETYYHHGNVICSNALQASVEKFIGLTVQSFTFHGPNTLTDKSPSLCQYGGVSIVFYSGDKGLQLCEDSRDFDIFSQK